MGMKKKITLFMLAVLGMAMHGVAQEVEVPQFFNFVKVDAGVNLRKAPSANSPRLVIDRNTKCATWEQSPNSGHEACRADVVPVMGYKDGFYQALYYGRECIRTELVWIKADYCHEVTRTPLKAPTLWRFKKVYDYAMKHGGLYADIDLDEGGVVTLGRMVDGVYVESIWDDNDPSYSESLENVTPASFKSFVDSHKAWKTTLYYYSVNNENVWREINMMGISMQMKTFK